MILCHLYISSYYQLHSIFFLLFYRKPFEYPWGCTARSLDSYCFYGFRKRKLQPAETEGSQGYKSVCIHMHTGLFKCLCTKSKLPPRVSLVRAMAAMPGYASCTSDPSGSAGRIPHQGGWWAQQKKSCGADCQSTTYNGGNYHHAAVMVSTLSLKISCKRWRRYQGLGHSWKEVKFMHIWRLCTLSLCALGKRLSLCIFHIFFCLLTYTCFVFQVFQELCVALSLPEQTRRSFISNDKDAQYQTCANDIIQWDPENISCKGPETNHKKWVKLEGQGGKTDQRETWIKTMMNHSLRKESSALLCKAVQGDVYIWAVLAYIYIYCILYTWAHIVYYLGLTPGGVFFNQCELKTVTLVTVPTYGSDFWTRHDSKSENLCHWGLIVGIKPHQKRKLIYRTAYSSEGSVPFFLRIRKWWGPASVRAVSSTIAHSIAILQLNEQLLAICRREMLVTPGGSHWTHFILALFFQKIDASVTAVIMRIYQYSFEIHYSVWSLLLIGTKFDDELQEQRYVFVKTENLGTKTSLFSTLIVKSNRQIIIWMQLVILWMGAAEGIFDFDLELKKRSSLATILDKNSYSFNGIPEVCGALNCWGGVLLCIAWCGGENLPVSTATRYGLRTHISNAGLCGQHCIHWVDKQCDRWQRSCEAHRHS